MRTVARLKVGAALLTIMLPSSLIAQILKPETQTGSRIAVQPKTVTGQQRAQMLGDFAKCVYRKQSNRVDYFLRHSDAETIDPALGDVKAYLRLDSCLPSGSEMATQVGARFSVTALRGWLAEQAYLDGESNSAPASATEIVPSRQFYAQAEKAGRAQALGAFSDCIVAQNSAGADALVRTDRGSTAEKAAVQVLVPSLGACLPQGLTISLKSDDVRGFAADGLWQRYEAAKHVKYEGRP